MVNRRVQLLALIHITQGNACALQVLGVLSSGLKSSVSVLPWLPVSILSISSKDGNLRSLELRSGAAPTIVLAPCHSQAKGAIITIAWVGKSNFPFQLQRLTLSYSRNLYLVLEMLAYCSRSWPLTSLSLNDSEIIFCSLAVPVSAAQPVVAVKQITLVTIKLSSNSPEFLNPDTTFTCG